MHFVCVCPLCVYSSLQCPVPVDPAVCPRYRGAAAAATAPVCVGRPLYTVGPGARHALVSGLRAGRGPLAAKKQKKTELDLAIFFWRNTLQIPNAGIPSILGYVYLNGTCGKSLSVRCDGMKLTCVALQEDKKLPPPDFKKEAHDFCLLEPAKFNLLAAIWGS